MQRQDGREGQRQSIKQGQKRPSGQTWRQRQNLSSYRAAINEANKLGIPVVGIVDSNSNPDGVDYVIPGNDDSIRAIKLYAASIADTVLEGKAQSAAVTSKDEFVEVADDAEEPKEAPAVEAAAEEAVAETTDK